MCTDIRLAFTFHLKFTRTQSENSSNILLFSILLCARIRFDLVEIHFNTTYCIEHSQQMYLLLDETFSVFSPFFRRHYESARTSINSSTSVFLNKLLRFFSSFHSLTRFFIWFLRVNHQCVSGERKKQKNEKRGKRRKAIKTAIDICAMTFFIQTKKNKYKII